VTGETAGYYADYAGDDVKLARALAEGFAFQGETMPFSGRPRGEPSAHLPPAAFVAFIQNHDQVGNRAFGERLGALADERALKAAAAVYLLLPQVPMLFMGEEWNAAEAFPFFCDFSGELGEAVTQGRRREFAAFPEFQSEDSRDRIPDPQSKGTFLSAKLDWSALERPGPRAWLEWYRTLLAVRGREITPLLPRIREGGHSDALGRGAVSVRWDCGERQLVLVANLSPEPRAIRPHAGSRHVIWLEGDGDPSGALGSWTVEWSIE